MQGRNGDTDTENRLLDTVGGGESGTNGEGSVDMCKMLAGRTLLCNTGSPAWRSVEDLEGQDGGGEGREAQEGEDIHIIMTDSCCTTETTL